MRFDVKINQVLTEPWQLSTAVLTSFSKFVDGLPIQRTLKYTALKADSPTLHICIVIDSRDFTMHKECFRAISMLRKNDDVIITEPEKGSALFFETKVTTSIK